MFEDVKRQFASLFLGISENMILKSIILFRVKICDKKLVKYGFILGK